MIQARTALGGQRGTPPVSELYRSPPRLEASCTEPPGDLYRTSWRLVQNEASCTDCSGRLVPAADNADKADNGLRVGLRVNHRHQETRSTATGRQRAAPRSFMSGLDPFTTPGDDGVSSRSGAINARQNRWTTRPATPNSSVDSPPKLFL